MGRHVFHGQVQAQAASQSSDVPIKSQLDSAVASALARANHTGTQTVSTISDFTTAVDARVQTVVGAAPAALDTLQELAAALGNDAAFSTTVTNSLTTLGDRVTALESATGTGSFKTNVGDATASTFTLTHNLNSLDVDVEVVQISNGQTVYPVVTRPSVNTVAVDFGTTVPANASHRILISKK